MSTCWSMCNFGVSSKFRSHYHHSVQCVLQPMMTLKFSWNPNMESAKLCALHAKNELTCQHALLVYVLTCQRALRAFVFTCWRALRAYVLTCQRALRAYVLMCQRVLHAYVPCVLTCSRVNMPCARTCSRDNVPWLLTCSSSNVLVFMPLFSVSLPLLLKLNTLLVRFKSLIIVFPR